MKSAIYVLSVGAIFMTLMVAGCGPEPSAQRQSAFIGLGFEVGQTESYRVVTENSRSLEFGGALEGHESISGGTRASSLEMEFDQEIQGVDNEGNAVAEITITTLKVRSESDGDVVLDFDSAADEQSPMAGLIGKGYTIKIAHTGEVVEVMDLDQARRAIRGGPAKTRQGRALLETDAVKDRHGISKLPAKNIAIGQDWSSVKNFSFDMMGTRNLERIYTLREIRTANGEEIAVADVTAIPTARDASMADEDDPVMSFFGEMFDISHEYEGSVKLNLTQGKLDAASEKLIANWVAAGPVHDQEEDGLLYMTSEVFKSIERLK